MRDLIGGLFAALVTIIGIVALIALYNNVTSSNRSSQALTDLTSMVGSIQATYISHPSFTSLSPTVVVNAKLAPTTMISSGALVNPWGGTVTVGAATNTSLFTVTEPSVPNDACVKMATSISNLGALAINGTSVTLPADPSVVAGACTGDANSLAFTFGH
jgi:hypothetical protein